MLVDDIAVTVFDLCNGNGIVSYATGGKRCKRSALFDCSDALRSECGGEIRGEVGSNTHGIAGIEDLIDTNCIGNLGIYGI